MRTLAFLVLSTSLFGKPCPLKGSVRDHASGAVMPGHAVRATNGITLVKTVANRDGDFAFSPLPLGVWTVTSDTPGYRNAEDLHFASYEPESRCIDQTLRVEPVHPREPHCKLLLSGYVYEQGKPMPGHVVRATNGPNVVTSVANREGYFEFLNLMPGDWWITSDMAGYKPSTPTPFATLHEDSRCVTRDLHLRRFGPREQLEEAVESLPGYAVALFQIVKEALGGR
jgi:hypothetical protein